MSSIVVAPARRAENTIYLAFSAVVVIFIQYLGAWIVGEDTQPPFVPNFVIVGIIAPIISAALIYSVPDEWITHKLLSRRTVTKMKDWAKFFLLSSIALKMYRVRSLRVRNPDLVFNEERDIVLEAGNLDTPIWRLRGVIWFVISLWLTVPITISIIGLSIVSLITIVTIGVVVSIIVIYPSWKWYIQVSQILTSSIEFHWLDRLLTAARRSDIAIDEPSESKIEFEMKGFTEAIYRGLRAAENAAESPPDNIHVVPDIARPSKRRSEHGEERPVMVKGRIYSLARSGISEKTLQDLIVGDVEWLRELVRRTSWSSFQARFNELRGFLILRGEESLKTIVDPILNEWLISLRTNRATHAFSNLRRLCFYLRAHNLLLAVDQQTMDEIIEYEESFMIDPEWAWNYYVQRMTEKPGITWMFERLASNLVEDYFEKLQSSAYDEYVGQDIGYYEEEYQKMAGKQLWPKMSDKELDVAKPMDYDKD